jgi:c-di-AMP phosphodiesterase-like protein
LYNKREIGGHMEILKRIKELNNIIDTSSNIFIMGHRFIDLDAIGGSVGMYEYVKCRKKSPVIIVNDVRFEKGVKKALDKMRNDYNIQRSFKIKNKINDKSLLIIVDTNKDYLLQDKNLLQLFNNIVVIDHHDLNNQSINNGLIIVDENSSSTCEMVAELLEKENINIKDTVATILLSGIVVDTNNFVIKTTKETYRMSYLLAEQGAKPEYVQYLLKQDIKNYVERQKVITNVKQIKNIAVSTGKSTVRYRREDLAKIADTLLQFDKIEASFVVGKLENENVGISARSLGNINVGKILEYFNGGGDENEAGACIENSTIKKVYDELKGIIKSLN